MCLLSGSCAISVNFTTKERTEKGKYRQWMVAIIPTLTIFTSGLQTGWVAPYTALLQSDKSPSGYPLSDRHISWIASGISVMAILSALVFSFTSDALGRQTTLIIIAINQILGFGLKFSSADPIVLVISQGLCGIATGGVYCVAPQYLKEISEDSLRAVLVSVGMLLQSLGTAIMYTMGTYLDYYTVLWIVIWVPVVNAIGLLLIPESPLYLVMKGKVEEATKIVAWTRGVEINERKVRKKMSLKKDEIAAFKNLPPISFKTVLKDKVSRKTICLSFLMITMLEMGGYYVILMYATVIINTAGMDLAPAALQAISFPFIMTLGSFASSLSVKYFGRKPLIVCSALVTGTSLAVLGAAILYENQGRDAPPALPELCIGLCLFANGMQLPLPYEYIMMCHMFTIQLQSMVLGVLVAYGWFLCALQTLLFSTVYETKGIPSMFFMFSLANLFGASIVIIFMPETMGKTSAQVSYELDES